jgi:hypothetical protein
VLTNQTSKIKIVQLARHSVRPGLDVFSVAGVVAPYHETYVALLLRYRTSTCQREGQRPNYGEANDVLPP